MMTLDCLKAKIASYRKLEFLHGTVFMMLLVTILFPTLFVIKRVDRAGFDSVCVSVISVSYGIIAALMFYVLARFGQKHLRRLEGNCPGCGGLLLGRASCAVIATNRCPRCGTQVLQ